MTFKYALVPALLAIALVVAALPVFAETTTPDEKKQDREHKALTTLLRKSGPSIHIGAGGRVQLDAATVTAVSGSELTVSLFGHTYVVNTENAEKSSGTPTVDSRVWVKGKMNESNGEIDATAVRTFTQKERPDMASTTPMKRDKMHFEEELKRLMEKLKNLRVGN